MSTAGLLPPELTPWQGDGSSHNNTDPTQHTCARPRALWDCALKRVIVFIKIAAKPCCVVFSAITMSSCCSQNGLESKGAWRRIFLRGELFFLVKPPSSGADKKRNFPPNKVFILTFTLFATNSQFFIKSYNRFSATACEISFLLCEQFEIICAYANICFCSIPNPNIKLLSGL